MKTIPALSTLIILFNCHGIALSTETPVGTEEKIMAMRANELQHAFPSSKVPLAALKGIAMNASAPPEVLRALSKESDTDVLLSVAWHKSTPSDVLAVLSQRSDEDILCHVALNRATPVDALNMLAHDARKKIRKHVAMNRSATLETQRKLLADPDEDVRCFAIMNISDQEAIRSIVEKKDRTALMHLLIHNPSVPEDVLRTLSQYEDMRPAVAASPSLPPDLATAMSSDSKPEVRRAVAGNRNTPAAVLKRMARDKDAYVRPSVALNPSTPGDVLRKLSTDGSEDVLMPLAVRHSQLPSPLPTPVDALCNVAKCKDGFIRSLVANNPELPQAVLQQLSTDSDDGVRCAVARNEAALPDMLNSLARDSKTGVREAVARNKATSAKTLIELSRDPESSVVQCVARNPSIPQKVLRNWVNASERDLIPLEAPPAISIFKEKAKLAKEMADKKAIADERDRILSSVKELEGNAFKKTQEGLRLINKANAAIHASSNNDSPFGGGSSDSEDATVNRREGRRLIAEGRALYREAWKLRVSKEPTDSPIGLRALLPADDLASKYRVSSVSTVLLLENVAADLLKKAAALEAKGKVNANKQDEERVRMAVGESTTRYLASNEKTRREGLVQLEDAEDMKAEAGQLRAIRDDFIKESLARIKGHVEAERQWVASINGKRYASAASFVSTDGADRIILLKSDGNLVSAERRYLSTDDVRYLESRAAATKR